MVTGVLGVGLALTLALTAVALAVIKTTTQSASSGDVTATFSYRGSGLGVSHARLGITRAGQVVYDRPVSSPVCHTMCGPGAFPAPAKSVRVVRLAPGGDRNVVLELYSEGANCCFIDQVLSYAPAAHTYVKTERNFASYGAVLRRLGPRHLWRFVSGDPAFACAFTDCADSGEPIQIWSFSGRRFHNVTRHYPKLVARDGARWLRLFKHHLGNGVGLIAAWAADQELLGHDKRVQSTLATQAARGHLRDGGLGAATGKGFIRQLNRLLHKLGYRR
ncbi:MAG: hypothetical protein M3016_04515 [Actinomycetota bacterium]|nr:hypothetical protein [Actinomycetota bacterium]